MLPRLIINVSNKKCVAASNTQYIHFIESNDFIKLNSYDILFSLMNSASMKCMTCGTFTISANSVYDCLFNNYHRCYVDDQNVLAELIRDIISTIIVQAGLSDTEFRDLMVRNEPLPDLDEKIEDLLDPFEDGNLYKLAYEEVVFKFGNQCEVCNILYY